MNDIPDFTEALKQFRRFLVESGIPNSVFWVFREDLWVPSRARVVVKYPPPPENLSLAQKVFAQGRERGLVEMTAVAASAEEVAAVVWYPKCDEEEVQGWGRGMRLRHIYPLPSATVVSWRWWRLIELLPGYRNYQRSAHFIGARVWAAA